MKHDKGYEMDEVTLLYLATKATSIECSVTSIYVDKNPMNAFITACGYNGRLMNLNDDGFSSYLNVSVTPVAKASRYRE